MYFVTAQEMYDTDQFAIERIGVEGKLLMENAGRAVADQIELFVSDQKRLAVLIGKGNNGGDGFVIARTLLQRGYDVEVIVCASPSEIKGDAAYHRDVFRNSGFTFTRYEDVENLGHSLKEKDVLIDALLGIGVKGAIRSPYNQLISFVNQFEGEVISVDLPSGLPADEGVKVDQAVQADRTVVIQYPKVSAFLEHTAAYYGRWEVVDIGLPSTVIQSQQSQKRVWAEQDVSNTLPIRDAFSHKGKHGKGLVIGGAVAMPGSIAMTSRAALRAGAGLLTVATVQETITALASTVVEATYTTLPSEGGYISDIGSVDFSYDAIAIGMGMGRHSEAERMIQVALEKTQGALLIDADGLYALKGNLSSLKARQNPTILTPHPGEMATLLDVSIPELLHQPFAYSKAFAEEFQVYVVLKGAFTIITTPQGHQWVTVTGNPGMAKGGSGDVLAGILLAMVMQSQTVEEALCNGTWIHGYTADLLVQHQHSTYDLLASDLIEGLAQTYRALLR
ncbi:bifunctional ADP-dependent NAD(P)H-hydrate dehydratase/NAD(P)H-hydrate epimerase [Pontibacillus yanchengensis]|uniref:Bifunctional NAD(P)H-hydrate repair enzyme n=1 Tax=Pontibacillus yanchengensis Y32 TaxID=1385514 RepID=A0A0A2TBW5_9BACI|nr:bifunctional ADP-dependent NAD(P)H-hydrate dehydratase/NAD(P)H-hydrate epimerase [Pontibacillus yanchengensis]KGP71888.1 hypothetical protein N782_15840 [Pontibacillus yanchengensis Y32]